MSAATAVRVLPRDVWDTLELVALAYGGIGAGPFFDVGESWRRKDRDCPRCAHGMALFVDDAEWCFDSGLSRVLASAGVEGHESDRAVRRINHRSRARPIDARVPFAAWTRELGIVRGDR